ncbi:MAG: hypothetical protein U9O87_07805, partial [Verrucomicrobiota bacterium]|nr:hypothetical protein [Verrucomicrobiota bacterium]
MIKLFSLHLLCFSLCITTICAEENNKIVFGGATLGDSLSNVLKKLQRSRKNYVGPNVTIVDMKSKIQAATYRLDGSLDRSRSVNSMALYFSADNILAGFEIRYNTSNPY